MLGLFRRWMFIIVGLAVVVTSVAAWFTSSWYCEEHVKTMLNEGFADAARAIEHNSIRLRSLSELSLHTAAVQAAMLDQLLSQKPELLYGKGKLELLAKLVDAQGIDVLDAHKTVIASSDQNLVGRRLVAASEPWGLEPDFGKFLANNATRSRASRGISDDDDGFLLYYYIPRRNRPGAIRLTYQTSQLRIFRALADLRSLSTSITVGENGGVDILREGVVVSSSLESAVGSPVTSLYSTLSLRSEGQMQCIERAGRRCIFATKKWGQYVLVAYLPEQAAYGTRNWSFGALIVANVIVFVAVYLVVTSLVRRKVVDGIKRVNHSLAEITAGNLDSHVEEHSSPEFISLSAGIN